jgi:uncharacterized lipoprotein YddW (UPF0748 family)
MRLPVAWLRPARLLPLLVPMLLGACSGDGPSGPGSDDDRDDPIAPRAEARALWVTRFEYMTGQGAAADQARIVEILEKARSANFNLVYFQVRGQGDAFYRSSLEPCAIVLCGSLGSGQPGWDPLEFALREAHARGLQLHAWLNALSGFSAPKSNSAYCANLKPSAPGSPHHMLVAHPEWAVAGSSTRPETCESSAPQGVEYVYVSPGIPAVRTHLARVAADVARRYAVDGVHLDRIRYPGPGWSYDTTSLRIFGRDPVTHPAEWEQFRRERVNLTVKEVHDSIRAATPRKVPLSAAVWGIYDDRWGWGSSRGVSQYFQDPRAWAQGGYLDVAVPMTYFLIKTPYCAYADWACLLDDHLGLYQPTGRHMYVAIHANTAKDQIQQQVILGRRKGVQGFAVFSYSYMNSNHLWPVLANGVFREKAEVPAMGWR